MKTYPVNLLLENKKCLIAGGGKVAARKMNSLLNAGAEVTVTAPEQNAKIIQAHKEGKITLNSRTFQEDDLKNVFLVYAATSDRALNRKIVELAKKYSILVCSVDRNWRDGDFITPASASYDDITISVSSCGVSCRKTKMIKEDIRKHIKKIEASELIVIGTDHRFLDLTERENKHLSSADSEKTAAMINSIWGIHEFMLFNTCNRIEFVGIGNTDTPTQELLKLTLGFNELPNGKFYIKKGYEAFRHLAMTISGMYSQTPGENHITAQFKDAVKQAVEKNYAGSAMISLKDALLHISKHIRTEVVSGMKVMEIENAAVEYIRQSGSLTKDKKILIAGTGSIGRNLYNLLQDYSENITVVFHKNSPDFTDSQSKTEQLEALQKLLPQQDIVFSALSTPEPVISSASEHLIKNNALLIDLGVPRNIALIPHEHKNRFTLLNMEDMKHWYRKNVCDINELQTSAENIIDEHQDYYERYKNSFINGHQGQ
jgi:glutamyl-tRNA reductase